MHLDTKAQIFQVVERIKPDSTSVYYGLILAEKALVAVIKNDPKITVIPSGKRTMPVDIFFDRYSVNPQLPNR